MAHAASGAMLRDHTLEKLRRREANRRASERPQPMLELPLPPPPPARPAEAPEESGRGVIVIDLF